MPLLLVLAFCLGLFLGWRLPYCLKADRYARGYDMERHRRFRLFIRILFGQ
jgi:hypothetical protein